MSVPGTAQPSDDRYPPPVSGSRCPDTFIDVLRQPTPGPASTRVVYLVAAAHGQGNPQWHCFARLSTFVRESCLSKRTVQDAISILTRVGLLHRVRHPKGQGRRTKRYDIRVGVDLAKNPAPDREARPFPRLVVPEPPQECNPLALDALDQPYPGEPVMVPLPFPELEPGHPSRLKVPPVVLRSISSVSADPDGIDPSSLSGVRDPATCTLPLAGVPAFSESVAPPSPPSPASPSVVHVADVASPAGPVGAPASCPPAGSPRGETAPVSTRAVQPVPRDRLEEIEDSLNLAPSSSTVVADAQPDADPTQLQSASAASRPTSSPAEPREWQPVATVAGWSALRDLPLSSLPPAVRERLRGEAPRRAGSAASPPSCSPLPASRAPDCTSGALPRRSHVARSPFSDAADRVLRREGWRFDGSCWHSPGCHHRCA